MREPWYSVPHVKAGDAFLTYMAGGFPKLVLNPERYVAPNTLHIVRFMEGSSSKGFAAGWHSSLTRLSCEIEGHALGGGMLKLEPTEAGEVLVALPTERDEGHLAAEVDLLLRRGETEAARELVDARVLGRRLGLSAADQVSLREAAAWVESWRLHR